jgi:murein DD-endopeptidase MepM/ murein hydrolase activator NlpD
VCARQAVRRALSAGIVCALALPLLGSPASSGGFTVAAATTAATQSQEELRQRELEAQHDLEESTAEVQAAAAALREVEAQLPIAEREVAVARGELAGARAKAAAATAAVKAAEAKLAEAQREVDAATARVEEGREDVGRLARRSYQRGRLGALRNVMEAGEPQDVVERTQMLQAVFKHGNASLSRLSRDRLALARTRASLVAEERELEGLRAEAVAGEERAAAVAAEAEAAAARVAALKQQREQAMAVAEAGRAEDQRRYEEAQRASRELAERIRAAAAKAAAEAAARAAAERAAAERAAAAGRSAPRAAPPRAQSSGRMTWPATGRLTSRYGYRTHPIYGGRRLHAGIDIGGGAGSPIYAADDGTVLMTYFSSSYGKLTVIDHGSRNGRNVTTAYAHQSSFSVSPGQRVSRGQRIGRLGSTGNSTGPHLHFEVRLDGDPVDPLGWVSPP